MKDAPAAYERWTERMTPQKKAVVLLSGGLDSTTAAAVALDQGFDVHALTIHYGQRHVAEVRAAERVAKMLGIKEHKFMFLNLREFGGSALTSDIEVPKDRPAEEISSGIPVTYVPARNIIFLSLALHWAEILGSEDIFIGVNALDYSGYPDCRPEFVEAYERLANLSTKAGVEGRQRLRIHAPLISLSKAAIIRRGHELGVDYGVTVSCYEAGPAGEACGRCDSCSLRLKGFAENGITDPASYVGTVQTRPRTTQ